MLERTVFRSDLALAVVKGVAVLLLLSFMGYTSIRLRQTQFNQQELAQVRAEIQGLKHHMDTMEAVTIQRLEAHDRAIFGDLLFKPPPRPIIRQSADTTDLRRRLSRIEWLLYTFGVSP